MKAVEASHRLKWGPMNSNNVGMNAQHVREEEKRKKGEEDFKTMFDLTKSYRSNRLLQLTGR